MKLPEIIELVDVKEDVFWLDPETNTAAIIDMEGHLKNVYKTNNNEDFLEVEIDPEQLADKLVEGFDVKKFLLEVLNTVTPAELIDIAERLEGDNPSVKSAPRCFALMIGGKPGRPLELVLRR